MGEKSAKSEKSEKSTTPATGGCLCGAVRYRVTGPLRQIIACHCEQCRRTSGHFIAATQTARADFAVTEARGLAWYRSSETARRGFCKTCGANLLWERPGDANISIFAGTLDAPTGLSLVTHIFTEFKGDYYRIPDDEEAHRGRAHGVRLGD